MTRGELRALEVRHQSIITVPIRGDASGVCTVRLTPGRARRYLAMVWLAIAHHRADYYVIDYGSDLPVDWLGDAGTIAAELVHLLVDRSGVHVSAWCGQRSLGCTIPIRVLQEIAAKGDYLDAL